jgi:hypothetical protein
LIWITEKGPVVNKRSFVFGLLSIGCFDKVQSYSRLI